MAIKNHYSADIDTAYKSNRLFDVISFECAVSEKEIVIAYTAAMQSHSTHRIASSLLKFLPGITLSDYKVEKFEEMPGYGIKGFVNGHEVIIGNLALMKSYDFFYDESLDELREPVILIMIDDRYSGCFLMMEYPQ